jgi:hypothetical protein
MGLSSKDFFTIMKTDSSASEMNLFLSLDMVNNRAIELDVDIKNLQRAFNR